MTRARRSARAENQQRELTEKYERLSDYRLRPAEAENHVDAMSADPFPASDPPNFPSSRRTTRRRAD